MKKELKSSNQNTEKGIGCMGCLSLLFTSRITVFFLAFLLYGAVYNGDTTYSTVLLGLIGVLLVIQFVFNSAAKEDSKNNTIVSNLNEEIEKLTSKKDSLLSEIEIKENVIEELNNNLINIDGIDSEKEKIVIEYCNKKKEYDSLLSELESLKDDLSVANEKIEKIKEMKKEIKSLKDELIETNDIVLLQSFGLYEPKYDFENSEQYMERLKEIRDDQKEMVKNNSGVNIDTQWSVDGSVKKGQALTNKNVKSLFRLFNAECDNAINKVTYRNLEATEKRIRKSFEQDNKLYEAFNISLREDYLDSKIDELYLYFEYLQKKQEEKEEQAALREQMREEAKVQKEIEKEKKKIEKEKIHFNTELDRLKENIPSENEEKSIWEAKIAELEAKIKELQEVEEDVLNKEKNTRAGYVYIISNIGSFGENIYKIGLTRRLDPMERVNELGDASVPFKFDVHATIFSEDAPALENALHKAFEDRRVNKVNNRKEFFNVTLDEIKEVVEKNFDKTVEYTKYAEAMEYRQSLKLADK